MTILAELSGNVTVTDDGSAFLLGDVEIIDDGPFGFELTVDQRAAVAMAQRFQQLGIGLTIDGEPIPDREIGDVLTITESADNFADLLTFQLLGEKWSPFFRETLRSKARVEVSFVIGNTANEFRKKVFTGYVVSHDFDAIGPSGPAATVQCMDAATLYAQKRAKTYTLAANSQRSRLSIGSELLGIGGIPAGHIDLPFGHGGIVRKPIAPGNQPILDYLRDFWGVLGCEIGLEDGKLCARRYDPDAEPVLELNASNLLAPPTAGLSITTPDTLAPNVTGVVSVAYSQEAVGGLRTSQPFSVITVGPYAPMTADGHPAWPEQTRVLSEVITRETYLGNLVQREEREEWGWYAIKAAPEKIVSSVDPPFYEIVPNTDFPVYTFPDGSTRSESVEKFRLISKTVTTKTVDGNYQVTAIREEKYEYHFARKAIWEVVAGEDQLIEDTFITDGGDGVLTGKEVIGLAGSSAIFARPDELKETAFELNPNGTIRTETVTEHFYDIGSRRRKIDGAFGYGVDSVVYATRAQEPSLTEIDEWGGLEITTKRYRASTVSEDQYTLTERKGKKSASSRLLGAPPRAQRAEPRSTSQQITGIVEDLARIALAGERIEDVQPNEFVETPEEAMVYSRFRARKAGALTLTCAIPIESLVHKFRLVRVNLPGTSIHGLKFYVVEVTRNASTYVEGIRAEHYPPELG